MIKKNLSPGGCADLLAIAFFFCQQEISRSIKESAINGLSALTMFSDTLEHICLVTVCEGIITQDMLRIAERKMDIASLTTDEFIENPTK